MSYSCNKHVVTREDLPGLPSGYVYAVGRKCKCGHAWCPRCGRSSVAKRVATMLDWDWRRVRAVLVSIDPKEFPEGPESAFRKLNSARSAYVRELNRRGARIERYSWFLEWHESGFPHFHFLFLVEQAGRAGQIGEAILKASWKYGSYVHESWIKSADHWANWTGYAAKTGYMGRDRKKQAVLPPWAMGLTKRIRRTGGNVAMPVDSAAEVVCAWSDDEDIEDYFKRFAEGVEDKERQTNNEIISGCGAATEILTIGTVSRLADGVRVLGQPVNYGAVPESYESYRGRSGFYLKGFGWCVVMANDEFLDFYRGEKKNGANGRLGAEDAESGGSAIFLESASALP